MCLMQNISSAHIEPNCSAVHILNLKVCFPRLRGLVAGLFQNELYQITACHMLY